MKVKNLGLSYWKKVAWKISDDNDELAYYKTLDFSSSELNEINAAPPNFLSFLSWFNNSFWTCSI